jgi:iron(III) transport system substrate-binding protein
MTQRLDPSAPHAASSRRGALAIALGLCLAFSGGALASCGGDSAPSGQREVVIYCALDQTFSEPLLKRFERETGIRVRAEYDVEAHKTVGLVNRLREERSRPRCDVFWNNEVAHTVSLASDGLLASYDSPSARNVPEEFRDRQRRWTGFAARGRVFIVNTQRLDPAQLSSIFDLVDPRFAGLGCMARPLTGTTLTHFTSLCEELGEERVLGFLRAVRSSDVGLTGGNAQVMRQVSDGTFAFGLTDTDDVQVALDKGAPVVAVWPDQDELGALVIPNTIAVLADAPHPAEARALVDWVLRPEIEAELAVSPSAQIPLRAEVARPAHVRSAAELKVQAVDWERTGAAIGTRLEQFKEIVLD